MNEMAAAWTLQSEYHERSYRTTREPPELIHFDFV